jgi:hypothetical protein
MRRLATCTLLLASLGAPRADLAAQWTVKPGGWFMSHGFNVGSFPDRFSGVPGATRNELDKVDWGMYFIYGLAEGWSVGLGQGYAHLEQRVGDETFESTGFGATGVFLMKRIAQGRAGVLSIQPRIDLPLLFDRDTRPALGPVEPDAELRLLYGNGFGLAGTRGFLSASVGLSTIRAGNDEVRYDLTVGVDAGSRVLVMAQAFNVAAFAEGGGIAYSATKLGGSAMLRLSPSVGVLAGYYGGVAGKNTVRERTFSIAIWLTHDPGESPNR